MALYSLHVDIHYPKSTGQAQSRHPALVSPNRKRQLHSLADSTEIASTPETQNRVIKCQTKCNGNGEGHFARLQLHKRKLTKRKSYIFFQSPFPMALALSAPIFVPNSAPSIENIFYCSFLFTLHCHSYVPTAIAIATRKIFLFSIPILFPLASLSYFVRTVFLFPAI